MGEKDRKTVVTFEEALRSVTDHLTRSMEAVGIEAEGVRLDLSFGLRESGGELRPMVFLDGADDRAAHRLQFSIALAKLSRTTEIEAGQMISDVPPRRDIEFDSMGSRPADVTDDPRYPTGVEELRKNDTRADMGRPGFFPPSSETGERGIESEPVALEGAQVSEVTVPVGESFTVDESYGVLVDEGTPERIATVEGVAPERAADVVEKGPRRPQIIVPKNPLLKLRKAGDKEARSASGDEPPAKLAEMDFTLAGERQMPEGTSRIGDGRRRNRKSGIEERRQRETNGVVLQERFIIFDHQGHCDDSLDADERLPIPRSEAGTGSKS